MKRWRRCIPVRLLILSKIYNMFGAKVSFTNGLRDWLDRLPIKLRGAEKKLNAAAKEVAPVAETEGQAAVIAAMGWDGAKWQKEVDKAMNDL